MRDVALQCTSKAHYFCNRLAEAGLARKYRHEFFNEFVTVSDVDNDTVLKALREQGADARVLFVVCRSDAQAFSPEGEIGPAFTSAFLAAHAAGVRADALRCRVTEGGVFPDVFLPLILPSR